MAPPQALNPASPACHSRSPPVEAEQTPQPAAQRRDRPILPFRRERSKGPGKSEIPQMPAGNRGGTASNELPPGATATFSMATTPRPDEGWIELQIDRFDPLGGWQFNRTIRSGLPAAPSRGRRRRSGAGAREPRTSARFASARAAATTSTCWSRTRSSEQRVSGRGVPPANSGLPCASRATSSHSSQVFEPARVLGPGQLQRPLPKKTRSGGSSASTTLSIAAADAVGSPGCRRRWRALARPPRAPRRRPAARSVRLDDEPRPVGGEAARLDRA